MVSEQDVNLLTNVVILSFPSNTSQFKVYQDAPIIVFEQNFPSELSNTANGNQNEVTIQTLLVTLTYKDYNLISFFLYDF
jgi:hypothetical protein